MTQIPGDNLYEDKVIRLVDLIERGEPSVLEGFQFVGCHIEGPAVIAPIGESAFTNCNLGGPDADALLWEIPPERERVVGAIGVKDCVFDGCEFREVGFAGPPDFIDQMRSAS